MRANDLARANALLANLESAREKRAKLIDGAEVRVTIGDKVRAYVMTQAAIDHPECHTSIAAMRRLVASRSAPQPNAPRK